MTKRDSSRDGRPKPVSVSAPDEDAGDDPLWGDRLRPGEEVGSGASGAVLRGTDTSLRRDVAIKVTRAPREELPTGVLARFVEEAQVTAQLEHPNIVPVHDLGVDPQGRAYFSMKLVRGQSLESILDRRADGDPDTLAEFGLRRLLEVFLQVCRAVEYAHARGVVHRDLKPANIMVGDFGEVLVMDWGIAKVIDRDAPAADTDARDTLDGVSSVRADNRAYSTRHGAVLGTPAYMSPEQARTADVDERSDVYSLGVILYEILCGDLPFYSDDAMEILARREVEQPPPPSAVNPQTPRALEVLVMRLLERDPERRTLGIPEIRSFVRDYIDGIGHEYPRESFWTHALWALGGLGLFAFLVWYLTGQPVATLVALTPSAVFNAIGWLLVVMAAGYPLWGATTGFATRDRDPLLPPSSSELFASGYLAHRTFSASIAPLFQLVFVAEVFAVAFPYVPEDAVAQLRAEWAHALIVIIVFLFLYLFLLSNEVRFARRIDRYVRVLRRRAWETAWPFVLIVAVVATVVATDYIDWTPAGLVGDAWDYVRDRIIAQRLDPLDIVKTLVFQGTFLVGLVFATVLLAFPFQELLASLRLAYQPVDEASVTHRRSYYLRSLAVFRFASTSFLYAGAMVGALTGLAILSGQGRGPLVEQVLYVLGPTVIGVAGFALIRRHAARHVADAPAIRRMLDETFARARDEHLRANLDQLRAASWRRRLLQVTVPVACIVGYLLWSGSGVRQDAVRELIMPVSAEGWLLILPYALLVPLLLVRDPIQLWWLRRRADVKSASSAPTR